MRGSILENHLPIINQAFDHLRGRIELSLTMAYGKLYAGHPFGEDTRGVRVSHKGDPVIPKFPQSLKVRATSRVL